MRAVVKIQGRQYQVEEGRYLLVDRVNLDRLGKKDGDTLEFGDVLLVSDGQQTLLGAPLVKDAKVKAVVLNHLRDKKVLVYKMRPKKGYRLKKGHRQELSRLMIDFIEYPGRTAPQVKPAERKPRPEKQAEPKTETKKASAPKAKADTADAPAAETKKAPKAKATGEKKAAKKPAAKKTKKEE